ncbi:MAG: hypothetical protein ACRC8S_03945 [Fimbriiglobus sp.]
MADNPNVPNQTLIDYHMTYVLGYIFSLIPSLIITSSKRDDNFPMEISLAIFLQCVSAVAFVWGLWKMVKSEQNLLRDPLLNVMAVLTTLPFVVALGIIAIGRMLMKNSCPTLRAILIAGGVFGNIYAVSMLYFNTLGDTFPYLTILSPAICNLGLLAIVFATQLNPETTLREVYS